MGHINLYDQKRLYMLMSKFFHNVFIFHMNDEVVHTGFAPMTCYIFALCCNKRDYWEKKKIIKEMPIMLPKPSAN